MNWSATKATRPRSASQRTREDARMVIIRLIFRFSLIERLRDEAASPKDEGKVRVRTGV
jgi:hypothetical protein